MKKTRIQLQERSKLKPQQFNELLKDLGIPERHTYEGEELSKIEAKLAENGQKAGATDEPKSQSPFDQVMEGMNQQQAQSGNPTEAAAALKHHAQKSAADIEITGNVMAAYYLRTGNYDDPEIASQVRASQSFLAQAIPNTSGTSYSLGKLLAGANIPEFNQIPAVAAEIKSMKQIEGAAAAQPQLKAGAG